MEIANSTPATRRSYVRGVKRLILHYNKLPEECTVHEVKSFLIYLKNEGHLSASTINLWVCSLKSINIARESLQCQLIIMLTRKERKALAVLRLFGAELDLCPCCKKGKMSILYTPHGNKDPPNKNNTESNIKE